MKNITIHVIVIFVSHAINHIYKVIVVVGAVVVTDVENVVIVMKEKKKKLERT